MSKALSVDLRERVVAAIEAGMDEYAVLVFRDQRLSDLVHEDDFLDTPIEDLITRLADDIGQPGPGGPDLRERIRKTVAFVESVPASAIDGTEDKDITVPRRDGNIVLKGEFYLKHYVHPNFYFHVTTAYALLRHNGVELGKQDFLALPPTA